MMFHIRKIIVLFVLFMLFAGAGCSLFSLKKESVLVHGHGRTTDLQTLDEAIMRARDYLLSQQHPQGYWCGFLENDSSVTAQYILLMHYLGQVDPVRIRKAVNYLLKCRNKEGGWVGYAGGPSDLDVTTINYVALAISGIPEEDKEMEKTRLLVSRLGGLEETKFFTKILLGFYNVFPWECLPWVSARMIENSNLIYRQGFARTILIPYMVLYEKKAAQDFTGRLPLAIKVWGRPKQGKGEALFQKTFEGLGALRDRTPDIDYQEMCLKWIAERQEEDGTWAGVLQVTLFSLMALHADSDRRWDEAIRKGIEGVVSYQVETDEVVIQQFSVSPVMDTAYAVRALRLAGLEGNSEPIQRAISWLIGKQSLREGDWKHNNPEGEPGGWSFESHNTWYPDLDCTSMVLNALTYIDEEVREPYYAQMDRGLNWVLSMQSWDGGFAVWDKNNWLIFKVLSGIMDVGDYSYADITARVVISMVHLKGLNRYKENDDLRKALRTAEWFLWRQQQLFQRWYGRWGANYTYGTGQVLEAMGSIGNTAAHFRIRPSVSWLLSVQNQDGGWGESVESYEKGRFVPGQSTAAQTSIVLVGLMAVGATDQTEIHHGISYLLASQKQEGNWEDSAFFAVNIPNLWYGRYDLISTLSGLIALCEYKSRLLGNGQPQTSP